MRRAIVFALLATAAVFAAVPSRAAEGRVPIIGGPCENCEAVFDGMPKEFPSRARIAPKDEPGAPMRIEGTVIDGQGVPAAGIIVYAYHTDNRGIYPRDPSMSDPAARHGRLRAWVMTDHDGRYVFDTIRPAGYPNTRIPAHVHMHIIEPECCTYYIDEINFSDDDRLPAGDRERRHARGGSGLVTPKQDKDGVIVVVRDIRLGANVPNHPASESE
jgi:protocatechuate 3,4-dioxygenase beta subunit